MCKPPLRLLFPPKMTHQHKHSINETASKLKVIYKSFTVFESAEENTFYFYLFNYYVHQFICTQINRANYLHLDNLQIIILINLKNTHDVNTIQTEESLLSLKNYFFSKIKLRDKLNLHPTYKINTAAIILSN